MKRATQIATLAVGMFLGSQAAAATQIFNWEVRATFDSVGSIGGVVIDNKEFVISGQTTTALSDTPWDNDPITAPLDLSTLSLSFDGSGIGTLDTASFFTYGLLGTDAQMQAPPIFRFSQNGDFQADSNLDSILFQMDFGGVDTWVGFGGEGGKRVGITTTLIDTVNNKDVVDFSENNILQSLNQNNNTRTSTVAPVPLPAGGWLLISALGGLVLTRLRRRDGDHG